MSQFDQYSEYNLYEIDARARQLRAQAARDFFRLVASRVRALTAQRTPTNGGHHA